MRATLIAVVLALGWVGPARSVAATFYVAPNGSDGAPGTLGEPFATVARAQQAVRALTPTMSEDVVVELRGGTYRLTEPLRLSDAAGDSGRNGRRVFYQAYGYGTPAAEHPVLSGGRPVQGWKPVDRARRIWRAPVGDLASRQLYRDGRRLPQSRVAAIPGEVRRTRSGYLTTSRAPLRWADPTDIELVFTPEGYSQAICGVAGVARAGRLTEIAMDQPCFRWVSANFTNSEEDPAARKPLVSPSPLRNSRSFLRRAGQWAIERSGRRHYVYYRAARGEDPNRERFVAPDLQTLVRGEGTREAPIHDVSFRGLTFADSGWTAPNGGKGFVGIFGDYLYDGGSPSGTLTEPTLRARFVPGALSFGFGERLAFEGDRFVRLGADALVVDGTAGNRFRGNLFAQVAGGALKLNGADDGSDGGNLVADNYVHDIGTDYQGSIGIYLEDVVDSAIQSNQLDHLPYSGIVQTLSEARGHGVTIRDNLVFDVVGVLMDGGGIYTSGGQGPSWARGALIAGNVVHGARNPLLERTDPGGRVGAPNGIYTDVGGDHITLRGNVLYDNHQSWGGVEPGRMRFAGNFWDDSKLVFYGSRRGLRIHGNTLLPRDGARRRCLEIEPCAAILGAAGLEPAWRHLLGPK